MDLAIHLPPREEDAVSNSLRRLTEKIQDAGLADVGGFGMGGEFGYGAAFENDVFLMHPFCWCEGADCFWCGRSCGCESGYGHYLDGREVSKKEYETWNKTIQKPLPWDAVGRHKQYIRHWDSWKEEHPPPQTPEYTKAEEEFDAYIEERDRRSGTISKALIHTCGHKMFYDRKEDVWGKYAAAPYPTSAPHFWHKPSGARVWWYKWIGRDMIVSLGSSEWHVLIRECFDSIKAKP